MNYHYSTPSECNNCVQRLSENPHEVLEFLLEKRGSGCRLFDSGDRTTTVCLFVLKRLLTSLRADIAKVLSDPSSNGSELIQLLCRAGESQADVLRRYERSRRDSRAVGRNGTSGASDGTYRVSSCNQATWHENGQRYHSHVKAQPHPSIPTHGRRGVDKSISPSDDGFLSDEGVARPISAVKTHRSEPRGELMDRSTQVTPVVDNTEEKATLTEETVVMKVDECCGTPLQTRNFGNQACLTVSTLDAEASTEEGDLYAFFGGRNIAASGVLTKDSALQVCLSADTMLSYHFVNNDSSSTDHSTTQGNSSDLSAGQVPFAKAATHLIRTDCGLLVFNADGSLMAEELWRRDNDNSDDVYRPPSQSTYSKASGVKVMECEDGDAGVSGVDASLPPRLNFFYHPNNASGSSGMWPEAGTGTQAPVQERRQPSVCSSVGTPVLLAKEITIVSSCADLPPPTPTRTAAARHEGTARRGQSDETSIEEIFGDMKIGGVNSPKSSTVSTGSAIIAEEEEEESTLNQVSPLPYG